MDEDVYTNDSININMNQQYKQNHNRAFLEFKMGDNSQNSKQVVTTIASYIARNINERFTFCE